MSDLIAPVSTLRTSMVAPGQHALGLIDDNAGDAAGSRLRKRSRRETDDEHEKQGGFRQQLGHLVLLE
jgi:hypothetical protein